MSRETAWVVFPLAVKSDLWIYKYFLNVYWIFMHLFT